MSVEYSEGLVLAIFMGGLGIISPTLTNETLTLGNWISNNTSLYVKMSFDPAVISGQAKISIESADQKYRVYYDETDGFLKWSEGTVGGLNYDHFYVFVYNQQTNTSTRFQTFGVWTRTVDRDCAWLQEGSTIIPNPLYPINPSIEFSRISSVSPDDQMRVTFVSPFLGGSAELPFYDNVDLLDTSSLKLGWTDDLSLSVWGLGFALPLIAMPDGPGEISHALAWMYAAEQNTAGFGSITSKWTPFKLFLQNTGLFHIQFNGGIGATPDFLATDTGNPLGYIIGSQSPFPWQPTNINWGLDFDSVSKTVSIYNADLQEAGETNIWIGVGLTDGTEGWCRTTTFANRLVLGAQFLYVPIAVTEDRYANSEPLQIQCCSDTVDEMAPSPTGEDINTTIDYSQFCSSTYLPDTSLALIKSAASPACDVLINEQCALPENFNSPFCSCINPSNLPLLPSNSFFDSYLYCFSSTCKLSGYRTGSMIDTAGDLQCPSQMCDIILEDEKLNGVTYNEAKALIECVDDGGEGGGGEEEEGIDTMVIIYIVIGAIVALALIIGLAVGIPAANKKKKKEKKKKKAKNQVN